MTNRSVCTVLLLSTVVAGLAAAGGPQAPARSSAAAARAASSSGWKQAAYVKASNPRAGAQFGYAVALSSDGRTLAVGSQMEESAATGINGNQNDHSAFSAGAVYVYARTGDRWTQQAYVKASNTGADDQFGFSVALSADGNTLAVSAPYEDSAATGINGNQADNSMANSGAVYVFTRSGSAWSQQAYVKASNTGAAEEGDQFGYSIALSGDGNTLVVGAIGEDSNATGINGDQANDSAQGAGAAYVFTRSGHSWLQQAYVKAANAAANYLFGYSVAVSANGSTVAVGSFDEAGGSNVINGPYDRRLPGSGAVYVFSRSGPTPLSRATSRPAEASGEGGTTWSQQAYLKAKEQDRGDSMGCWIAISEDGNTVAAGALDEDTLVPGINVVQSGHSGRVDAPDDTSAGAAYVFVRNGTTWSQQANFKASNVGKTDWFGVRLNLSGDGNTMAVSAPNEDSAAQGINGKQDDDSADEAGAVYVFTRDGPTPLSRATSRPAEASGEGGPTWSSNQVYFKGSNTRKFDEFGSAVALSRDGRTMAVGAHFESSGAKGINGNQADNSMSQSGAVYIFTR
jgi:hypothetical protein